ncbi:MAG: matrixin family metalloprotease [Planctomycetes bacterium]|nr:matrixin family metalloprotease [Planctomycetota bacterium]
MNNQAKLFVLPAMCLGAAALLLAPARPSEAFSTIGGNLGETQRDVRVFDNFLDATADDNVALASQFPGWTGLELAMWKAIVEWGSRLHGDGSGDPLSGNLLGSGGANFDAMWSGNADGVGTTNNNIASSLANCGGGGTLAFLESPISDGWRIRFCDEWTWDDGPGSVSLRWDIQSVMTHEYGHALGLGHSAVGSATMAPSGSAGSTGLRSIAPDDIAGVQFVYSLASATKPTISATVADTGANTLTIYGTQFGATGNEVWFTNESVTGAAVDPIVRVTGVSSTAGNTIITVTIPAAASPGDVMVNKSGSGGATLSNAFPTDLVGTFGIPPFPHPNITGIAPSSIEALVPGTAETITLTGTDLNQTTSVTIDGSAIPASRWTIVNPTTITLDMPMVATLGAHNLGTTDGFVLDQFPITVVAPATPKLEWGTGDAGNVVDQDVGLTMTLSGQPGQRHIVLSSPVGPPSLSRFLDTANLLSEGASLAKPGSYTIPASGWLSVSIPNLPDPAVVGANWFGKSFSLVRPLPFVGSNDQSITLVP